MMPVSGKRMCSALEAKGWVFRRITGSHHIYGQPGNPMSVSVPVHRNEDLAPGTQRGIMRDAGLTDDDLRE